jgi:hypothetical protein
LHRAWTGCIDYVLERLERLHRALLQTAAEYFHRT